MVTRAKPNTFSEALKCAPATNSSQPHTHSNTGGRMLWADTSGMLSHLGPAVKRNPLKKSGMKPNSIHNECASVGAIAHGTVRWFFRSTMAVHHKALPPNISAAAKKARRWGAANNHLARHWLGSVGAGRVGLAGESLGRIGIMVLGFVEKAGQSIQGFRVQGFDLNQAIVHMVNPSFRKVYCKYEWFVFKMKACTPSPPR